MLLPHPSDTKMKTSDHHRLPEDWTYENAGIRWQDGLILGNGNLGLIGYAPYGLEWTINKGDIFDGRCSTGKLTRHREVMARIEKDHPTNLLFLSKAEPPPKDAVNPLSKIAGLLKLKFGGEDGWAAARPHKVGQRLVLREGTMRFDLDMHLSHPRVECIVPRDGNVCCIRLTQCGGALWDHSIELARPPDDDLPAARWGGETGLVWMEQKMPHKGAHYAMALFTVPTTDLPTNDLFARSLHPKWRPSKSSIGAPQFATYSASLGQAGNADIYLAVFTSYEDSHPLERAIREVKAAARQGYASLAKSNAAWWRQFWQTSSADFGTQRDIQKYWDFSLYQTACLLGRAPVPGLYGLWYGATDTPRCGVYASAYTHDQNVQIPMFPVFPLNHVDLVEPFIETYRRLLPTLRRETRAVFQCPGVCIPLSMNQLGREMTDGAYRYSLCGGAYTGLIMAWAWKYAPQQRDLARRIYPVLKELVRFYVARMATGADGRYHLEWEVPPEIYSISRDNVASLAMLKPCLQTLIELSDRLGKDASECRRWRKVLDRYPEFPRRRGGPSTGLRAGWWAGPDIPENHYTQAAYLLYPFFPAEAALTPEDERTAALTLENSDEHDVERSYADQTGRWHYKRGWAWFFPTLTRLRLGQRREGWAALGDFIRDYAKPNGLFAHNPIIECDPLVTEANLKNIPKRRLRHADGTLSPLSEFWCHDAATAGTLNPNAKRWVTPVAEGSGAFLLAATETLLQSHGGLIRLFPCVPDDFTGSFSGLLAQGGIEVSSVMKRGTTVSVALRAARASTVRMLDPSPSRHPAKPPRGVRVELDGDRRVWRFPLQARRMWTWDSVGKILNRKPEAL